LLLLNNNSLSIACRNPAMKYITTLFIGALLMSGCSDNPTQSTNSIDNPPNDDTPSLECTDGISDGFYPCNNIDLLAHVTADDLNAQPLSNGVTFNDIWGWTDPQTGKEYALIGHVDGTSFVDVSNPSEPIIVGHLPKTDSARASTWRDIKVYKNYAYVVADNAGPHGMQVFDLTNLRNFDGVPRTFSETTNYAEIHSAHNVVINDNTGFAYIVGSTGGGKTCGSGLHMVNIQDPANPSFEGCFADPTTGRSGTGYTHDAQCVTYNGPDPDYQNHEICLGANETAISVADVTDKDDPKALSTASYPGFSYVHQGWFTEDQQYFLLDDELDETDGNSQTKTYIWDMQDLDDPVMIGTYKAYYPSIDHNQYVKGNHVYQSNYTAGLRILNLDDVGSGDLTEVAYFDTYPVNNDAEFFGTWSSYPYFESGIVIVSDITTGLFILKPSLD